MKLVRVDRSHRQSGREQGTAAVTSVASTTTSRRYPRQTSPGLRGCALTLFGNTQGTDFLSLSLSTFEQPEVAMAVAAKNRIMIFCPKPARHVAALVLYRFHS